MLLPRGQAPAAEVQRAQPKNCLTHPRKPMDISVLEAAMAAAVVPRRMQILLKKAIKKIFDQIYLP